jgi:hypothetical protein
MADPSAVLARRYRRLLVAYPPSYRTQRGDELVATLLDVAEPGRRMPRLGDSVDLVASGLRRRLGTATIDGFDAGLGIAAPVALALAGGISLFAWWRVEPVTFGGGAGPAGVYMGGSALFGQFRTLGPIAYLAWLGAAAGWALAPLAARRALVAFAVAVTLALPVASPFTPVDRPPLWVLMALAAFGLLALAGSAGATRPLTADDRLVVPGGALAVALCAWLVTLAWPPAGTGPAYYYQPTVARVGAVVGGVVTVIAAIAVVRLIRRRPVQEWLWATVLIGLPAGWLGPFETGRLRAFADSSVPHFGRLAQVLFATCVAMVAIVWLAQRRTTPAAAGRRPGRAALAVAGAGALGGALGLAALLLLAARGLVGFEEPSVAGVPGHVSATLAILAFAGLCAWLAGVRPRAGARPAAGSSGRGRAVALAAGALTGFAAGWLVAIYDNGWTVSGWSDFPRTAALVTTVALVPLSACLVTAALVFASAGSTRRAALGPLLVCGAWLGYLTFPYVFAWGPVVLVFVACAVVMILKHFAREAGQNRSGS